MTHFELSNLGSIALLQPRTSEAEAWVKQHLNDAMRVNGAAVIEHRYVDGVVTGIEQDGMEVEQV